jgi:hypothetical protein
MTNTWIVYLEPIYDAYTKTYLKVLTLSDMPDMPLMQYVRVIKTHELSNLNRGYGKNRCIYVLLKELDEPPSSSFQPFQTPYMEAEDIPRLFGYMVSNGYAIESGWTTILQKSKVSLSSTNEKKTLMFVFRKN